MRTVIVNKSISESVHRWFIMGLKVPRPSKQTQTYLNRLKSTLSKGDYSLTLEVFKTKSTLINTKNDLEKVGGVRIY